MRKDEAAVLHRITHWFADVMGNLIRMHGMQQPLKGHLILLEIEMICQIFISSKTIRKLVTTKIFFFILFISLAACQKDELTNFPTKDLLVGSWAEKTPTYGATVTFSEDNVMTFVPSKTSLIDSVNYKLDPSRSAIFLSTIGKPLSGRYYNGYWKMSYKEPENELTIWGLYASITNATSRSVFVKKGK